MARLTAIHAAANALLLWLGYYWLGVGEARTSTLVWSLLLAVALIALTSWIYGGAFVFFAERRVGPAYRRTLRNLPPLVLLAILALLVYFGLARPIPAATIASYLTLHLRKPVSPHAVLRVSNVLLWLIRWVAVPVLLIPLFGSIAARGWAGWRRIGASRWWLLTPVLLLGALWAPLQLLGWVPHMGSFAAEMASFIARALLAYLLFIGGWLMLAFVTSGGRPRATQANIVVSP